MGHMSSGVACDEWARPLDSIPGLRPNMVFRRRLSGGQISRSLRDYFAVLVLPGQIRPRTFFGDDRGASSSPKPGHIVPFRYRLSSTLINNEDEPSRP